MGRYYLRQQEQKQWLCYLCGTLEEYNRGLYQKLYECPVEGLILVSLREEARGRVFLYNIGNKTSLSKILEAGITEERLLILLLGLLFQVENIKDKGIDLRTILWSSPYMFVEEETNQIGFIVHFGKVEESSCSVMSYIESLLTDVNIYATRFFIKRFIMQYMEFHPSCSLQEFSYFLEEVYNKYFGSKEYSGQLTLTSRLDEKGIHIEEFAKMEHVRDQSSYLRGEVYLIRARTKERIPIVKDYFYIGKEASAVDYCIHDNAAISRSHACIIVKNYKYYIRDLGSTNRTYVNNLVVSGDQLQELRPGYRITLANEVFYFN